MLATAFGIVRDSTLVVRWLICSYVFICVILSGSTLLVAYIDTVFLLQLVHMSCLSRNIGIIDALFTRFLLLIATSTLSTNVSYQFVCRIVGLGHVIQWYAIDINRDIARDGTVIH